MRKIFKCILYTLLLSFPLYFLSLILFTPLKLSDLTSDRISLLANRPENLEKDIVVDLTSINTDGGMATYAEEVMKYLIANKPNYRWIIIHSGPYGNKRFTEFLYKQAECNNNILFVNIKSKFGELVKALYFIAKSMPLKSIDEKLSKWLSSQSCEFNDVFYRFKQIFLHGTLFVDRHCDLIFSLATPTYTFGYGVPQVSVIHDVLYLDKPEMVSYTAYKKHVRAFSNNFNYSNKLISISNFTKDCILKYFDNIHEDKIAVIVTQMASRLPSVESIQNTDLLTKFNLEPNNYLVFASKFWVHKNHARLVEAFAKIINKADNNFKMVFMGAYQNEQGGLMKNAKRTFKVIEEKGIKDRVVFTGYTTNEEFNAIMSRALAVVNPSLYEGFGMPVAEAMLLEKPVVCSNVASLPEVGGDAALYFDPYNIDDMADKLYQVYSNKELRKSMIEKGKIQVKNFTNKEKMLKDMSDLLDKTMAESANNKYKIDWNFCSVK